jgi:hypothetical protein
MRESLTAPRTFTNHALDQFLEHLLTAGIKKIVRIGTQSRSAQLEDHNLRRVTQHPSYGKTKQERWQARTAYAQLEKGEEEAKKELGGYFNLAKKPQWKSFDWHLRREHPRIHAQFAQTTADGFTVAGRHPFDIWVADAVQGNPAQLAQDSLQPFNVHAVKRQAEANVESLTSSERQVLLNSWVKEIQSAKAEKFFELVHDVEQAQHELKDIHEEVDRRALQDAEVIGLTTSGLARHVSTLHHVQCKVLVCEEAGEVMEPHLLSALLPSIEHFIQIGDHEQLRPTINNFALSLESTQGQLHQLDRSQFERLSVGEPRRPRMPIAQLDVQRRMRPDISVLIRRTIYDRLSDHAATHTLPDVVGMRKNVFWLDHQNLEDGVDHEPSHNKSKSNAWEVKMLHALIRHLVRQGKYSSQDIAVLTPYTGQLQKLRLALRSDFEIVLSDRDEEALDKDGFNLADESNSATTHDTDNRAFVQKKRLNDLLRAATVDNFQGEEAKVIIVSLVRSNTNREVGFLKTTNRINVLLSRAQHGMYLVGNSATYANVPMWQQVTGMLREANSIGPALELCCPRHPDTPIAIRQPDDFAKLSPEGGCREPCMDRLSDCGHRCQARCHSQAMHDVFKCEQPCERRHKACDHACQKATCGEDCGKCMVPINDIQLACGHIKHNVPCHKSRNVSSLVCQEMVAKEVPRCYHVIQVPCTLDVSKDDFRCPAKCEKGLACGHMCPGTCGQCRSTTSGSLDDSGHAKCEKVCKRPFSNCTHYCPKTCHDGSDCGLCMADCEVCHKSCPCMNFQLTFTGFVQALQMHFEVSRVLRAVHRALHLVLSAHRRVPFAMCCSV